MSRAAATYVEETRFGFWFLQSRVWQQHVLRVAIDDLKRVIDTPLPSAAVLLDAGCGQGKSFSLLQAAFAPAQLIGLDADPADDANDAGGAGGGAGPTGAAAPGSTRSPGDISLAHCR